MPTAPTATKKRPKETVNSFADELRAPSELLEAEADRAKMLAMGASRLVWQIEARCENIEPHELRLTPTESSMLRAGGIEFDSIHELCRIVQKARGTRDALNEFSFEKLAECRVALAEAQHATTTTAAGMDDLEFDEENAEPALVRQLANLQKKLDSLRSAETTANDNLRRQESLLQRLEDEAPECLKDLAELRKREAESDPKFRQFRDAEDNFRRIQELCNHAKPGGPFDPHKTLARKTLVPYAEENGIPINPAKGGSYPVVDQDALVKHFEELRESLPKLKAERDQLEDAYKKLLAEVNPMGPIHDWIDARGMLTAEMLQ